VRGFPSPHSMLRAPRPLCYVFFFVVVIAYYSVFCFSFFPGWGLV
jgi:hypothetical protein